MFSTGTHARDWTFSSEDEICNLREEANKAYKARYAGNSKASSKTVFLTPAEERTLCKYFEYTLGDLCRKFKPPMPRNVISCSFQYYKRFYLNNSIMDYHPKHMIVTCVFLACKVEEFNVSIMQFVANVKGDRAKAKEIILSHELLLMQHLKYHLIVHHPYRPVEGFLIDIKTRCPQIYDPERLRAGIDEFLDKMFYTDAVLLYAPSQFALAAIVYAGNKFKDNLMDEYILEVLFADSPKDKVQFIKGAIKKLLSMEKSVEVQPPKDQVRGIDKKLEKCRNEENNPSSEVYKRRLEEMQEEEEMEQTRKYLRLAEKQARREQELLGIIPMES